MNYEFQPGDVVQFDYDGLNAEGTLECLTAGNFWSVRVTRPLGGFGATYVSSIATGKFTWHVPTHRMKPAAALTPLENQVCEYCRKELHR